MPTTSPLASSARIWRLSIWQSFRQRHNPTLKWILLSAIALLALLLTIPGLRDAFNFGPMKPVEWLVAIGAGLLGVAWFEAYKLRARRPSPRSHPVVQEESPGDGRGDGELSER